MRIKDFRGFLLARFLLNFSIQMQSVIVGWQVYQITGDVLQLGFIGLAEAIPFLGFAIISGYVADRFNRRAIIIITNGIYLLCAILLLIFAWHFKILYPLFGIFSIYVIIFFTGVARSFFYPAQMAFMAQLVPKKLYPNSSTWNSAVWQISAVTGPAVGGLIYGFASVHAAYLTVVAGVAVALLFYTRVRSRPMPPVKKDESLVQSLSVGVRFVFSNQVILGAMALDMFAVLFGGAVAVLPAFASEVLHIGPEGLGFLRAAPAIGAIIMSVMLAYRPPLRHAGHNLLMGAAGFGVCIILFALSRNFYLSFVLLAFSGLFDNISVVIRSTIMQMLTPDAMRGRVAAVNSIFVGSSNEIGSFESGLAARLMGLITSVVFGGTMTLLIVASTAKLAPKLRNLNLKLY